MITFRKVCGLDKPTKPQPDTCQATLNAIMHLKLKRPCEVLVSTVIIAVMTVTLFLALTLIRNSDSRLYAEPGRLIGGLLFGIIVGLLTMGVYIIPSALLVSMVITYQKRWSLKAVGVLFVAVLLCSSVSNYLIDPTASREHLGAAGYFTRLDWFASKANLTCTLLGFAPSLIAFWMVNRWRRRSEI
jgi:hypothetical protein